MSQALPGALWAQKMESFINLVYKQLSVWWESDKDQTANRMQGFS